jgi:hypothetical protein
MPRWEAKKTAEAQRYWFLVATAGEGRYCIRTFAIPNPWPGFPRALVGPPLHAMLQAWHLNTSLSLWPTPQGQMLKVCEKKTPRSFSILQFNLVFGLLERDSSCSKKKKNYCLSLTDLIIFSSRNHTRLFPFSPLEWMNRAQLCCIIH